ncbi:hypothetical protein [Pseudoalteromonas aurantia]|uniref:Uncharacterized protein n=1 Tax=Pseudoalteromonas aurantia 208 TaxID=1314867 RepID=A0ABR9EHF0_9GAMM|nr:hypothetical protein [Pseudoalteromonas aurantia]MBE0370157.1 hypothetical protein [Pseudoalteromonas aurantia 208]
MLGNKAFILVGLSCLTVACSVNNKLDDLANTLNNRWVLDNDTITWQVKNQHNDHLEFSGEKLSAIIYYGNNEIGNLVLNRKIVWPMLRTVPNDTHASLIHEFPTAISPNIYINDVLYKSEKLTDVSFNGVLTLTSSLRDNLTLTRVLSPSTKHPALIETYKITNTGNSSQNVEIASLNYQFKTPTKDGVYGAYTITAKSNAIPKTALNSGDSIQFSAQFVATKTAENRDFNSQDELKKRLSYIASLNHALVLETPDPILNQMFQFSKLRAAESIYRTKGGLMHGPGGGRYYAALWANDQAEYINPFFPFLGDNNGNESAVNSYRHFARFMNDKFDPIPSSIIAEGVDIWNGAGDRGDCAMIAYGASRFALSFADEKIARELTPLIDWCLEYSFKQMNSEGVIGSDSDELEGRFKTGQYNLSTNMLTYGALKTTSNLHDQLGNEVKSVGYSKRAFKLKADMNNYFSANVQGYDTYQYFKGNTKLRSWIALPLTMGIFDKKQDTLNALLSPQLWSADGIYTEAGNNTFWDRATLYAFRGIFAAGETDIAMRYFKYYSRKRLLGEHVPYAVEAWPEGNQRHLSAESALYARVVTEGIFGIEPLGFNRFQLAPYLPSEWPSMCLKSIKAFKQEFDICVERKINKFEIVITHDSQIDKFDWDGIAPITYTFD